MIFNYDAPDHGGLAELTLDYVDAVDAETKIDYISDIMDQLNITTRKEFDECGKSMIGWCVHWYTDQKEKAKGRKSVKCGVVFNKEDLLKNKFILEEFGKKEIDFMSEKFDKFLKLNKFK